MKKINKLILVLIISVIGLFFANVKDVYAYDILYQAWVQETESDSYVLYRTYTTPHPSTIEAYPTYKLSDDIVYRRPTVPATYLGKQSKWAYESDNANRLNPAPTSKYGMFQTYGLLFHGGKNATVGKYGFAGANYSYATFKGPISDESTLNTNIYNNVDTHSIDKVSSSNTTLTTEQLKAKLSINSYIPLPFDNIAYEIGIENADDVDDTSDPWFRMSLIAESEKETSENALIYVTDRKLTLNVLNGIASGANEKNIFFDYDVYKKCIRVSNMIRAKSFSR